MKNLYQEETLNILNLNGEKTKSKNFLVLEKPLYIYLNSKLWTIVMRSPQLDKELSLGLLYSEGIINSLDNIIEIEYKEEKNIIDIKLKNSLKAISFKESISYTSGEKTNKNYLVEASKTLKNKANINYKVIIEQTANLKLKQPLFLKTHATHAVALYKNNGELIFIAEDVGRHNAMDKVIGHILLNKIKLENTFFVLSGRGSLEMIYKTINIGVPLLACISIPTYKALEIAKKFKLALVQVWGADKLMVLTAGLVTFE